MSGYSVVFETQCGRKGAMPVEAASEKEAREVFFERFRGFEKRGESYKIIAIEKMS